MSRSVKLCDGHQMPLLGLGCWQSPREEVSAAVEAAIKDGYRHIDTAYNYLNEDGVGDGIRAAIKAGVVTRKDLFVVTKLPMIGMRPESVEKYLKKSLKHLGLDYVDLYLVHAPIGFKERSETDVFPFDENGKVLIDPATDLIAIWRTMEKMVKLGLTKSIGVSNYTIKQLVKTLAIATIQPAVHQVECHVYFQQKAMRDFCKKHNIAITAYAPLGSPGRKLLYEQRGVKIELPDLLRNPVVKLVAENHKKSPAQVLLRFLAQQDLIVIPKSTNAGRIHENGSIFDFVLTQTEMEALKLQDRDEAGRTFSLNVFRGADEHPEAPDF